MFVLCTSRYAAPVKFTLFVSLHRIVFVELALKICAVIIKALVKFTLSCGVVSCHKYSRVGCLQIRSNLNGSAFNDLRGSNLKI